MFKCKNNFVGAYFLKIPGTCNPEYSETVAVGAGISLEKGMVINERILIMSVYSI